MKRIATSIILASCAIPLLLNCGESVLGGGYPGTGGHRTATTTSMTTTSGAIGNACGATPVAFAPPATYPVYGDAIAVATGDLNGDGVPDLAVLTNGINKVSILLNHGDGTFAPQVDYPTPWNPKAIVAAPLRGGHAADLVVMENNGIPSNGALSVIPNNGDGTFAAGVVVPLGEEATALAIADLDGDGKPDLLVTLIGDECGGCGGGSAAWPKTNEVGWLRNNGDGTFAPLVTYPTGVWPAGVTAGDVNGDGRPDVIVTNQGDDTVSVLMNMGGGVLAPKVDYPTGYGPSVVAAADLNGDGRADLAVINWYTSFLENPGPKVPQTVSVLLAKEGGGFAPKVDYVTDRDPVSLAVADLNGDGKPDLAVAHNGSSEVGVFLGRGDGSFDAKIDWNGGEPNDFLEGEGIVAADLNGDGRPDLAVANNYALQTGGGGQGGGGSAIPRAVTVLLNACHESGGGAGGAGTTAGGGGTGGCVPGTGGSGCYGGGCVITSTTPVESEPIGTQGDWLETFNLAGSAYTCSPGPAGELTVAQCEMLCPPSVTMQPLQQCAVVVGGPVGGQVECRYSNCGSPCAF